MEDIFSTRKRAKKEDKMENNSTGENSDVKPEARYVEEFLDEPTLFSPKPEFLTNTYLEVS